MNLNILEDKKENEVQEAIIEEIQEEIADLEEYARQGKAPPHCRGYRLKINGVGYVVYKPIITGREVLALAGLAPAADYTLRIKIAGQRPEKVGLDEKVNLRKPGIEKFKATPREQTEG